jgi:hypothetical protein
LKLLVSAIFTIFTIQLSASLDSAITARLEDFNAQAGNPIEYRLLGQTANDDGAILYLEPISQASGVPYPGVVDWAVAERDGNNWTIYLPGDPGYSAAYNDLPDEVLRNSDSTPYVPQADPTRAGDLSGYSFPWADGAWGTVVRSYRRHGNGRIDFDLSGREIVAAKDGLIVYADDHHTENAYSTAAWWYWNTVIIQHGAHEYSLYGHIAPDSIPQWIKDGCSRDLSRQNCALAISAGQMIALEGSTGFSSAPHLHFELGQDFAVVAYPDTADEDGDGVRGEPVYSAYVYREQGIGISGNTADDVGGWRFGTLQQATHKPPPAPNVNLLTNGDFSDDTDGWIPSGQLNWTVQDGSLRFTRLRTSEPPNWATFHQDIDAGIHAYTPFESTLQLGNASGIAKTVTVSVFNRSGKEYGSIECVFSIPPNTALTEYTIRGVTVNTWASARYEIGVNPPDGSPATLADNITLQVSPTLDETEDTQCIAPTS